MLIEEHLDRIAQSAEHFSFRFDEVQARKELNGVVRSAQQGERLRVRLVLKRDGGVNCTACTLPVEITDAVDVLLWHEPTVVNDRFLRHKTTHRALYDGALARARALGFADSLFQNTKQEITEGAIHNVIARLADRWVTPPVASGLLPGTFRKQLLQERRIAEQAFSLDNLLQAEAILICNSVRGLRQVRRLAVEQSLGGVKNLWTIAEKGMQAFRSFSQQRDENLRSHPGPG